MKRLILALVTGCSIVVSAYAANKDELKIKTIIQAEKHNVPVEFALALITVESNFNPLIRGKHGEYGLGQIKCSTAKSVGFTGNCKELFDPDTNLEYSMKYLRLALNISHDNVCHAATYYNSGIRGKPRSSAYCKKVLALL